MLWCLELDKLETEKTEKWRRINYKLDRKEFQISGKSYKTPSNCKSESGKVS
jgi:hypothetical protein